MNQRIFESIDGFKEGAKYVIISGKNSYVTMENGHIGGFNTRDIRDCLKCVRKGVWQEIKLKAFLKPQSENRPDLFSR